MIGTCLDQSPDVILANTIALARFYIVEMGNVVGGNLHIVLSDGNTANDHILFCLNEAVIRNDHVGAALAKCLLELNEEGVQAVYDACGRF